MVRILLEAGADPNIGNNYNVLYYLNDNRNILNLLIEYGLDLSMKAFDRDVFDYFKFSTYENQKMILINAVLHVQ